MRPKAEVDNSPRDLQNSSYPKKAAFKNCFIIHSKYFPIFLHFVFFLIKNNTTSSSGFLSQWFNNMQQAALLTLSVQYDKVLFKFGQQQLVMVNYACGFNQSETGKYIKLDVALAKCQRATIQNKY